MTLVWVGTEVLPIESIRCIVLYEGKGFNFHYLFNKEEVENADFIVSNRGMAFDKRTQTWFSYDDIPDDEVETALMERIGVSKLQLNHTPFKYDEERLLKEFSDYVAGTYNKHYVGEDNVQSLDLIFAVGHGEGFCRGNCIKYSARSGKKAGQERDDLMKLLHYALLALYEYDRSHKDG